MNIGNILNRRLGLVTIPNLQRVVNNLLETIGFVDDALPDSRPYKVYSALLTEENISENNVLILENTLGEVPAWTENSIGNYSMTTVGDIFTPFKTEIIAPALYNDGGTARPLVVDVVSENEVILADDAENSLNHWHGTKFGAYSTHYYRIEIRVYN